MASMATSSPEANASISADCIRFSQDELERRLIQLERLAAVGELSSTTTHEFNNLLMTIINYAKLGMRNKDELSRDKAFSRILDAANRGAKITSTVLGLARTGAGQMLLNLVTNARQAIGERGTIRIRISQEKGAVVMAIRDNGCGIPKENLPKLFQPFFTTKSGPDASGKGGTGLGLSACKEIIDEHRGRIRVDSTVGKGTEFIIRFPATLKSETASESQ
jgi:signal transduction histidine kinase